MATTRSATDIFEQEFLTVRAKLLEVAAALDRISRAEGSPATDRRVQRIHDAIHVLLGLEDDRAERIQLIFSRPYERDWQEKFRIVEK